MTDKLMSGITVLSQSSCHSSSILIIVLLIILSLAFFVLLVFLSFDGEWKINPWVMSFFAFSFIFFTAISISECMRYNDIYNQYKVIIDDSVSLNEFNNNYEIISEEGKIYTIKEKEKY